MMAAATFGTSTARQWRLMDVIRPSPTAPADARYKASDIDDVDVFLTLLRQWRSETLHCSLARDMVAHPAFERITAMGHRAIPWIIRELRSYPDLLVLALPVIASEDPVPPSAKGKISEIVNAWLVWYDRNKMDVY
jgi:hypothetical protein